MKRIKEYKKLFNIEGQIDLKELKTSYRNLVKEYHPDKFLDEAAKEEAEKIAKTKLPKKGAEDSAEDSADDTGLDEEEADDEFKL